MSKLDAILATISEDSVDAPSTSVMPGSNASTGSPLANAEFTTLADVLNHKTGMDIGSTNKVCLGAPLQNILSQMADVFLKVQDLRNLFKTATKSPVYRERGEEFAKIFTTIDGLLKASQSNIKLVSKDLDKLSLDSSE